MEEQSSTHHSYLTAHPFQVGMVGLEPTCLTAHDPKSCAAANYATSPKATDYTGLPLKSKRLWLERLGLAAVTVIALGTPIGLGLFGYLALTDGIDWNTGDPAREGRVWMLRDKRKLVGLGLLTHRPEPAQPGCATAFYTGLLWSPSIQIEHNNKLTC